jgi:hypothetical protein
MSLSDRKKIEDLTSVLKAKANEYESAAKLTGDKFNKGYFEGKAEAALLVVDAIKYNTSSEMFDVMSGDL